MTSSQRPQIMPIVDLSTSEGGQQKGRRENHSSILLHARLLGQAPSRSASGALDVQLVPKKSSGLLARRLVRVSRGCDLQEARSPEVCQDQTCAVVGEAFDVRAVLHDRRRRTIWSDAYDTRVRTDVIVGAKLGDAGNLAEVEDWSEVGNRRGRSHRSDAVEVWL
jgi:hypothetical protein